MNGAIFSRYFGLAALGALALFGPAAWGQTIYVSSHDSEIVGIFNAAGTSLGSLTGAGINGPNGLVTDSAGNIYVANADGNSIEKYSSIGHDDGVFASTGLNNTMGLAIDAHGNIYAANFGNDTIEKFDSLGNDQGVFFSNGLLPGHPYLDGPTGLAFGPGGHLFVGNYFANNVWEIDTTGASVGQFANSNLGQPGTIAFDSQANLYVTSQGLNRVEKFDAHGNDLATIATGSSPNGIAFDRAGNYYVVNTVSNTVSVFNSSDSPGTPFAAGFSRPTYIAITPSAFIPEPSSWALLAGALALGASASRRRQRIS